METVCGYHGTVGILTIPKSSWSGFLLSSRDSKQFRVTELSGFSAVPVGLSGFQTIPEDGIIWFHCHTTRKRVRMKKAVVGLCVSGAIGLWSAMKRASIRVFLDKNLETFLRNATLHDLSFFFPLGDLPRLSCVARQTGFCAVLMTRKLAPHAQSSGDQAF